MSRVVEDIEQLTHSLWCSDSTELKKDVIEVLGPEANVKTMNFLNGKLTLVMDQLKSTSALHEVLSNDLPSLIEKTKETEQKLADLLEYGERLASKVTEAISAREALEQQEKVSFIKSEFNKRLELEKDVNNQIAEMRSSMLGNTDSVAKEESQ